MKLDRDLIVGRLCGQDFGYDLEGDILIAPMVTGDRTFEPVFHRSVIAETEVELLSREDDILTVRVSQSGDELRVHESWVSADTSMA